MSKVRSDQYTDRSGTASPLFPNGLRVTGVTTSSSGFVGALTGAVTGGVTGNVTGNATGLSGTPNILVGVTTVGVLTGTNAYFSGNVTIGGTLTKEDVTNIDSVGVVTAGKGVRVTAQGINVTAGISTFKGANFNGGTLLKEKVKITAGKLSDNLNIDLENGMVYHFTTQETTTAVPNIRVSSSVALNSVMDVGDSITVSVITTAAAGGFSAQWTIDGSAVTEAWNGGAAPSAGGASGKDFYTLNIIKTGNAAFTVLANVSNFA